MINPNELEAAPEVNDADLLDSYVFDNPDDYQDQTGARLLTAGVYELKPLKYTKEKKDKNGKPIVDEVEILDPATGATRKVKYKTAALYSALVVGGLGEGQAPRKIGLLQDIRLRPFPRGEKVGTEMQDILRAFDVSRAVVRSQQEAQDLFEAHITEGNQIRVRLDWFAEDYEGRKVELERVGHIPAEQKFALNKEQLKTVYDRYRVTSMYRFNKLPGSGAGFDPIWKSPTGAPIEGRLKIVRYFPSTAEVSLGADVLR